MYCMKPLVTVSMETKQCVENLTCDCMTHQVISTYYQVIAKNINKVLLPEAFCCCLQTCNSCNNMYMMVLMFGQSLMVTGVTVIMLHAKITPYYNVLHEAISYCFHGN